MTNDDRTEQLRILYLALRNETETRQFYVRAKDFVRSPQASRVFASLAEEEAAHQKAIRRQVDELEAGRGWLDLAGDLGELPSARGGDVPALIGDVARELRPEASDADALEYALRLEMNSHTFYSSAAAKAANPAAEAMYDRLAAMERLHFEELALAYEDLMRTGPQFGEGGPA